MDHQPHLIYMQLHKTEDILNKRNFICNNGKKIVLSTNIIRNMGKKTSKKKYVTQFVTDV